MDAAGQNVSLALTTLPLQSDGEPAQGGGHKDGKRKDGNAPAQSSLSTGLRELCCFYSTKLSYSEVADLMERLTGRRLVCDQSVCAMVRTKACAISRELQEQAQQITAPMPIVTAQVDVYSPEPEVLVYSDAILVTRQKPKHSRRASLEPTEPKELSIDAPKELDVSTAAEVCPFRSKQTASGRVSTDVVMLERRGGGFEYVTAAIDADGTERISEVKLVRAFLRYEYGGSLEESLPVVAITDGASSLRAQLLRIFGHGVTVVLDWFHLCKKVREEMTTIARTKDEKIAHIRHLLPLLWRGDVAGALDYLRHGLVARNVKVRDDLAGYLEKHAGEIINDEKRRAIGKSIGSGRMEKGVDLIVGQRQKQKAMSWSDRGSKALALLHTALLNGRWRIASEHGLLITA